MSFLHWYISSQSKLYFSVNHIIWLVNNLKNIQCIVNQLRIGIVPMDVRNIVLEFESADQYT